MIGSVFSVNQTGDLDCKTIEVSNGIACESLNAENVNVSDTTTTNELYVTTTANIKDLNVSNALSVTETITAPTLIVTTIDGPEPLEPNMLDPNNISCLSNLKIVNGATLSVNEIKTTTSTVPLVMPATSFTSQSTSGPAIFNGAVSCNAELFANNSAMVTGNVLCSGYVQCAYVYAANIGSSPSWGWGINQYA